MSDNLKNSYSKVAYILKNVPAARYDNKLLLVLYWQTFDDIPMSNDTAKSIIERATEPETILRSRRKIIETISTMDDIEARVLEQIEEINLQQ